MKIMKIGYLNLGHVVSIYHLLILHNIAIKNLVLLHKFNASLNFHEIILAYYKQYLYKKLLFSLYIYIDIPIISSIYILYYFCMFMQSCAICY